MDLDNYERDTPPVMRHKWKPEDLKEALKLVRNKKMSQKKASETFQIPRTTLRRYVRENWDDRRSLGRNPFLTKDQEEELGRRLLRLAEVGFPLTPAAVCRSVYSFCTENKIRNPFNNFKRAAGRAWLKAFLKRHPEIRRRKSQNLNEARARKLNKEVVHDYFAKLKTILEANNLMHRPERIFNLDEKGIRLCQHKSPSVLTKKGAKRVYNRNQEHGENVTIVACANAIGNAIPPIILFKGQRMKPEWKDDLPPGAEVFMTQKGSMTVSAFLQFLDHFAKYKPQGKITHF